MIKVAELSSVLQVTAEWVIVLWNKKRIQTRTDENFLHNNSLHAVKQGFPLCTQRQQSSRRMGVHHFVVSK